MSLERRSPEWAADSAACRRASRLKTQVGVVGHGGHPEDTGISPGQGAVSWGHRVPGHAGVSSGYGVPRIPRCPGTPYPEDTGGILGKPRYPEDTSGVLGIPYPQDTDGILRIPRCPEDTAGVLRCLNREDAPVSSGHRILRMPSVSHDANLHFQTGSSWLPTHYPILRCPVWSHHIQ